MNLLQDPSFELGVPPWVKSGLGQQIAWPRTGVYGWWLQNNTSQIGPLDQFGRIQQDVTFEANKSYRMELWIYVIATNGVEPIRFTVTDLAAGRIEYDERLNWLNNGGELGGPSFPINTWNLWNPPNFLSTFSGTGRVRFAAEKRGLGNWGADHFFLDDASVEEEEMARRKDIKAALVTYLGGITIGNGFSQDIGQVFDVYVRPDCIETFPSAMVLYGPEERTWAGDDRVEHHRVKGTIEFVVRLDHLAEDADDKLDLLAADVETRIETKAGGAFLGLNYIDDVRCRRIAPVEATEEVERDHRVWMMIVEVVYKYTRTNP